MLLETDILNRYKAGDLKGIYVTELCFYIPIRITGTGKTIRKADDKFYISDRDPSTFLSEEVIDACAKLPIILYHPEAKDSNIESSLVSYKTLKENPIIGQTIYAYRKGEEVWAIARVYDMKLLDLLNKDIKSTSPGVFSYHEEQQNGASREVPTIFNHIAFVEAGHWDQKSEIAYDDSQITVQGVNEVMADKEEKLEQVEEKEAQHFEEMAEEHKEALKDATIPQIDKEGEEMAQEVKPEEVKTDEETEEVKTDEETEEVKADEETEVVDSVDEEPIVDDDEEPIVDDDEEPIVDDDEVEGEVETDEDKERNNIIDTMTELADSIDESVGFKKVFVGRREKPTKLLGRIIKANKHLIDKKYLSLADSVNYSNYGLAVDALNNLIDNAEKADAARLQKKLKSSNEGWVKLADGIAVNRNF